MARSVQTIEKDLHALEGQAAGLGEQLQQVYHVYLQQLGSVLRNQLALAGYQMGTQKYPEAFLALTLEQQQDLQGAVRQLGKVATEQLSLEAIATAGVGDPDPETDAAEDTANAADTSVALTHGETPPPGYWLGWVQRCEEAIAQTLQQTSVGTNQILHKMGILPERMPVEALEAAARAREPGIPNAANLSEISIEVREKNSDAPGEMLTLAIVQLRLSELELSDPTLQGQRRRLQELGRTLGALLKKYARITQEHAIARAELAWRTSWFDED